MVSRRRVTKLPPTDHELTEFLIQPQLVGTGAYSTIWRADSLKHPDLKLVAKISKKNARRTKTNYQSALSVLLNIHHPNLIKLHHFLETTSWYYLFLEYHPKPTETLTEFIIQGALTEVLILKIVAQVADVIAHLHENGWGHRDIKPCNILYNPVSGLVTVLDLGFAMPTTMLCDDFTGSPLYAAPEVLGFQKYSINLSDCWSLGVCLFQLLYSGRYPYLADDLQTLTNCVINDPLIFPKDETPPSSLRDNLKGITEKLLKKDPADRITSSALRDLLKSLIKDTEDAAVDVQQHMMKEEDAAEVGKL